MSKLIDDTKLKATKVSRYLTACDSLMGIHPSRTFTTSRKYGFDGQVTARVTDRGKVTITYVENTLYRNTSSVRLVIDRIKGFSITGQRMHLKSEIGMDVRQCCNVMMRVLQQTFPDTGIF